MKKTVRITAALLCILTLYGCKAVTPAVKSEKSSVNRFTGITAKDIPEYSGKAFTIINDNAPFFTESEITAEAYEEYGELDRYGRCTACTACIGNELMPKEERGEIYTVEPTGWQHIEFDFIEGGALYNRCHLIGFQLTGENANANNLITGTRYINVEGMLPFENEVASYINETGKHVLYRVTPIFKDNELVARGVEMEAYSVEDKGEGVCFNVFCYNVQPGVEIDYKTGNANKKQGVRRLLVIRMFRKNT